MSSLEVVGYIFEKMAENVDREQIVKDIVNESRNRIGGLYYINIKKVKKIRLTKS